MRNHPAHASPRRDLRNRRPPLRPIRSKPDPIRWSESGRTPLVRGGQGRYAGAVVWSVEVALICALGLGLVLLIVALGLVGNAIR